MANDGPQSKETELERLGRQIDAKVNEWHMHGWDPDVNWPTNSFIMSTRIDTIVDVLKEQLEISDEEWAIAYAKKLLHNLTACLDRMLEEQAKREKPQIDVYRGFPHGIDGNMN